MRKTPYQAIVGRSLALVAAECQTARGPLRSSTYNRETPSACGVGCA